MFVGKTNVLNVDFRQAAIQPQKNEFSISEFVPLVLFCWACSALADRPFSDDSTLMYKKDSGRWKK